MSKKNSNKKMSRQQLNNALAALDEEDRERVLGMAKKMEDDIRSFTRGKIMFGRMSSLELIAKMGIFYIDKNIY